MLEIYTENLKQNGAPLYHKYPRQCGPQPALIELDCRGEGRLSAGWVAERNATSMYVWHRMAVEWSISPSMSRGSILELFDSEEFLACCDRILAGFETRYDGNNYVGVYDEDAQIAIEEISDLIDDAVDAVDAQVWDAEEWLFNNFRLSDHWGEQPIADAVAAIETDAADQGVTLYGDIKSCLLAKALVDLEESSTRVNRTHVKTLWSAGIINYGQVRAWLRDQISE